MFSGGDKPRPYFSKGNPSSSFKMKTMGFRSGIIQKNEWSYHDLLFNDSLHDIFFNFLISHAEDLFEGILGVLTE